MANIKIRAIGTRKEINKKGKEIEVIETESYVPSSPCSQCKKELREPRSSRCAECMRKSAVQKGNDLRLEQKINKSINL